MKLKFTKITALLYSVITILLVVGVIFIGSRDNSMEETQESFLKFNAKTVSYISEETLDKEETSVSREIFKDIENSKEKNNQTSKSSNNTKEEKTPSFDGLRNIEFVKYIVKDNDTLWDIAEENIPNYDAYPVGGLPGIVSYIGKENNLNKDSNDSYIVYSGQKIIIPREKTIVMDQNENNIENNSVTVKTQLSVTKKTNIK